MHDVVSLASLFEDSIVAFSNKTDKELKNAFRLFQSFNNPLLLKIGTSLTNLAFQLHLPIEPIVKATAYKQFCGGETLQECEAVIEHLSENKIFTALQFSVETKSSEEEFDKITNELLQSIAFASKQEHVKVVCCKPTGIASIELLERLHAKSEVSNAENEALERVRQRMIRICEAAATADKKLFFDAEETWIQQPLDDLVNEMMLRFNKQKPVVYNTFQLYAKHRLAALEQTVQKAKSGNYIAGAKLVRGAYMEKERERALKENYPSPIQNNKEATDKVYNAALEFCLHHLDAIAVNAATHNEANCLRLIHIMEEKRLPRNHPHILFSQLYGMGEHITYNLAKAGYNAMKLVPYGPVREAIPYLIRRAQENSSVSGQVGKELVMIEKEMKRRRIR